MAFFIFLKLSERARSILGKAKIYVNSQVFWIQSDCDGNAMIYDVYHILPKKQFAITYLGKAPDYTYDDLNLLLPLSRRRQNLRNIILRTAAVVSISLNQSIDLCKTLLLSAYTARPFYLHGRPPYYVFRNNCKVDISNDKTISRRS